MKSKNTAGQATDIMGDIKYLTDNIAIATVECCINGGNSIVEDMYGTAVYNRRIENNLPFPPDDKYFVGMLGLNEGFIRFTKK